jgi:hypothetical protein
MQNGQEESLRLAAFVQESLHGFEQRKAVFLQHDVVRALGEFDETLAGELASSGKSVCAI